MFYSFSFSSKCHSTITIIQSNESKIEYNFFIGLSSMNTQTLLQTQTETEVNNY